MRQIKFNVQQLMSPVKDSMGGQWKVEADREGNLTLSEVAAWAVRIEGILVGKSFIEDPAEAVRAVFAASGLHSLPEAVAVFALEDLDGHTQTDRLSPEEWVIFTLGGEAYKVPRQQFGEEVEKSTRWVQARQAKRHEIDALMLELKKLGG